MIKHGVNVRENPTSVIPAVDSSILTVYVGTAAVNMVDNPEINEPILCFTYEQAVKAFGKSNNFKDFTLHEAIDLHFSKFGQAPICLINVLDPKIHKTAEKEETLKGEKGIFIIEKEGVIPSDLVIDTTDAGEYVVTFNDDGYLVIMMEKEELTELKLKYKLLDPTAVDSDDIIGGIDVTTGKKTGLELIGLIYPKYRIVPFLISAPKFSYRPEVAAVLETKTFINEHFRAHALVDLSSEVAKKYIDAPALKVANNLNSTHLSVSYPMSKLGDKLYHMSTQRACLIQKLASQNEGIPYASPSNNQLKADSVVLEDKSLVRLEPSEANYLNSNGINTGLNFANGLTDWGNFTSCYPSTTDSKDAFITSRLMNNYINNTLVLTYWSKIDNPTNKTLINLITTSCNVWLSSLVKRGYLLGGRVEFREEDNSITGLMSGKISLRVFLAHVLPAQEIEFVLEVDVNYYNTLFAA